MWCFSAQASNFPLIYSGPLSTRSARRGASPLDDPLQTANHALGRQRKIDINLQAFTIKVVQHIQQPEHPAISQR